MGKTLFEQGKFREAVLSYNEKLKNLNENQSDRVLFVRGLAYLNLSEYENAFTDFEKANDISNKLARLSETYRKYMGVALWLMGKEAEAFKVWEQTVLDSIKGKIKYSDEIAGVLSGALLWFVSCFDPNPKYQEYSKILFEKKAKYFSDVWAYPIADYLMLKISEEELLRIAGECETVRHKDLCQAYFYIGVMAFLNADKIKHRLCMESAVREGKFDLIEDTYYLALYERDRFS